MKQYKYDYWTAQKMLGDIRRILGMAERPKWYEVFMKKDGQAEPIQLVSRAEGDEVVNIIRMFTDLKSEGPAELLIVRRFDI